MIEDNKKNKHVSAIDISISELMQFQEKTKAPRPVMHQYIGTIIDTCIGLLCLAANTLDDKNTCFICRNIKFSAFDNWQSMMSIIHRTFYSTLHISIELGINEVLRHKKLMPLSSLSKNYLKKLNKIVFPLCLISDLREEDTPEERKLYVKSQHGQLFYRTNLTNSKECEITSEDFLAIGIDENRTQSFFVGIKTNEDLLTFIEIYKYDLLKIIAKREHIPKIDSENLNDLEKIKKYFEGQQATFTDKLNAILRFIDSSDTEKNSWRKFFDGLRILRNKSSHSDPSLSEAEVQSLQDGGFAVMVSNANTLQLNTRQYAQVVKGVLDFWDKFDRQ